MLKKLRDLGNTVIVVEHEEEIIRAADTIVDIGPLAGYQGGEVMFCGGIDELLKSERSLTARYLTGRERIDPPRREMCISDSRADAFAQRDQRADRRRPILRRNEAGRTGPDRRLSGIGRRRAGRLIGRRADGRCSAGNRLRLSGAERRDADRQGNAAASACAAVRQDVYKRQVLLLECNLAKLVKSPQPTSNAAASFIRSVSSGKA